MYCVYKHKINFMLYPSSYHGIKELISICYGIEQLSLIFNVPWFSLSSWPCVRVKFVTYVVNEFLFLYSVLYLLTQRREDMMLRHSEN